VPAAPTTPAPSQRPSLFPTGPTTHAPTHRPLASLQRLDLILVLDRSASMNWWSPQCTGVIRDGGIVLPTAANCWELWILFVDRLIVQLFSQNPLLHWTDSRGVSLRVGMYAFWCTNSQTVPQMAEMLFLTGDQAQYQLGVNRGLAMVPDGGTCPGLTLEQVLMVLGETGPRAYPFASVVTFTDGVFYDMPRPSLASQALRAACANTFAVAVAENKTGPGDKPGTTGFTPQELATQRAQLLALAGQDSHIFTLIQSEPVPNPWQALFDLLNTMAADILAASAETNACTAAISCDFQEKSMCTSPYVSHFCKWTTLGTCTDVANCNLWKGNSAACNNDRYCLAGTKGACTVKTQLLPSSRVPIPAAQCVGKAQSACSGSCAFLTTYGCQPQSFCGFGDQASCAQSGAWCYWDPAGLLCKSFYE
jgi:hypothetical protein